MLLASDVLSPSPAASWKGGPTEWGADGANDRTIYDPSWTWCLSVHATQCPATETPAPGPKTLEGPMTVEWWAECLALCATSSPDWTIRVWVDGGTAAFVDQQVPVLKLVDGAVHKLRATVNIPRVTATQRVTVQLEPVFLADSAASVRDLLRLHPGLPDGERRTVRLDREDAGRRRRRGRRERARRTP